MTLCASMYEVWGCRIIGGERYPPSEANQVVGQFNRLNGIYKLPMLNFLRAL